MRKMPTAEPVFSKTKDAIPSGASAVKCNRRISRGLSDRIKLVNLSATFLVVLLHSHFMGLTGDGTSLKVQQFLTDGLCRVAVPVFFMLSGFLFAWNMESSRSWPVYRKKIGSRLRSLGGPYLIWFAIGLVALLCLKELLPIASMKPALTWSELDGSTLLHEFAYGPSVTYQLWFLRSLIITVCLSPLIVFCVAKMRIVYVIFCFWLYYRYFVFGFYNLTALAYFSTGVYLALFHFDRLNAPFSPHLLFLISGSIWIGGEALYAFGNLSVPYLHHAVRIAGFVALWCGAELVLTKAHRWKDRLLELSSLSFFVFLLHEPLLTLVKLTAFRVVGLGNTVTEITIYLALPVCVFCLCLAAGLISKKHLPRTHSLLTGGR